MTPNIPNDAELLRLMAAGDEQAFAVLYRRYQGPIYRFGLLMCGSVNIAEEVTQEVFLVLVTSGSRFDPSRGLLLPYLYGLARIQVLRFLKRERPYVSLVDETDSERSSERFIAKDDPFGDCSRNEVVRLVRQAVLTLPPRYREVVVLCDFQEVSCTEAAIALDCALGTVSSRLHRGRLLLLKKLSVMGKRDSAQVNAPQTRCFA
ncbi:MAG TPA: sigma-70 family RNA polymerase sigma factor [Pyrinomonadaceae bacterium]|jgi:RNA polymerase sigma-70 factor (ECF subfamily)|nr:sigma-70 family RNA polymerase sigma factor [Pyrinomonadaceae bacterium]